MLTGERGAAVPITSSQGSARLAPAPRCSVLREIVIGPAFTCHCTCLNCTRNYNGGGAEWYAQHDSANQRLRAVLLLFEQLQNLVHGTRIRWRQAATQSIAQHPRGEVPQECRRSSRTFFNCLEPSILVPSGSSPRLSMGLPLSWLRQRPARRRAVAAASPAWFPESTCRAAPGWCAADTTRRPAPRPW
jgi:hypothetical protein